MAIILDNSAEYDQAHVSKTGNLQPTELHGRIRCAFFTHNQSGAGDATSSVALVKLPAGRVRLLGSQSKAYVNWTTTAATLDLGWDAYTDASGAAVVADPNGIDSAVNVDTVGFQTFGSALVATGGTKVFSSKDGVVIRATSQTTAIAAGDDLVGCLFYVVD